MYNTLVLNMKAQRCISVLLLITITCKHCTKLVEGKKPQIPRQLSPKPRGTLKTIKVEDGDVIDCVDIYKQSSLDHPLLKDHTIQMRPSSSLRRLTPSSVNPAMAYQKFEGCPEGTIPIRRSFKTNAIPSSGFLRKVFPSRRNNESNDNPGSFKFATLGARHDVGDIHGSCAQLNVWNPWTELFDFSVSQIWMVNVQGREVQESLQAGWIVQPLKYGDPQTRLFLYYINNVNRTACYDMECPGFVQVDRRITLGMALHPISTYSGIQCIMDIGIVQDMETRNIWFRFGMTWVGYWASVFVPRLSVGANFLSWGGEIYQGNSTTVPTTTQMGSGHFPVEGQTKASYMAKIVYLNSQGNAVDVDAKLMVNNITSPGCYGLSSLEHNDHFGSHFYYGGPGRSRTC